jgi:hypothetical protein
MDRPLTSFKKIVILLRVSIRGAIQNILDWCCHLYSSCGSAKHRSQQAKQWIPSFTATFCGDCVKTLEDVASKFGENRPGCFTMTTPRLTLPSSPRIFWRNSKWPSFSTHRTPTIRHPVTSSYFQKGNWYWKDAGLIIDKIQAESQSVLDTLTEKEFQEAFQKWRRRLDRCLHAKKTTSRVMVSDRPYCEFYDFYSASPEYFG